MRQVTKRRALQEPLLPDLIAKKEEQGIPSSLSRSVQNRVMRRLKVVSASPLPPLYDAWMSELLSGPIPSETEATCDDCAMCTPGATSASELSFDPRVKCCTYLPVLPNFLVGRILGDRDEAARKGRKTVEARMREKIAVTPLGIGAPSPHRALYQLAAKHSGFGRTPSLRCNGARPEP